jgi:hypothetical protein
VDWERTSFSLPEPVLDHPVRVSVAVIE